MILRYEGQGRHHTDGPSAISYVRGTYFYFTAHATRTISYARDTAHATRTISYVRDTAHATRTIRKQYALVLVRTHTTRSSTGNTWSARVFQVLFQVLLLLYQVHTYVPVVCCMTYEIHVMNEEYTNNEARRNEVCAPVPAHTCKVTPWWDTEYPLPGLPIEQVSRYSRILVA